MGPLAVGIEWGLCGVLQARQEHQNTVRTAAKREPHSGEPALARRFYSKINFTRRELVTSTKARENEPAIPVKHG